MPLPTLPLLHTANQLAENPSSGITLAYFDDISNLSRTDISQQTLQLYKTDGPSYGFYVNPTKTIILLGEKTTLDLAIAKKAKYCDFRNPT